MIKLDIVRVLRQFPHCDQRVLHAPGECQFCDAHQDWQALRQAWGIAFTNHEPEAGELPCPANHARGAGVNSWYGNTVRPAGSPSPFGDVDAVMQEVVDLVKADSVIEGLVKSTAND